jgi:dTDP-4-dehydrorhamnose 3,5-epimerase
MPLKQKETSLPGVVIIEVDIFTDTRGFFFEAYHQKKYADIGLDQVFVQDNLSHSRLGTLRGLHYQLKHAQAKLIYVVSGEIFDVAVDVRRGSPTFGQWTGVYLSQENRQQIFVPRGFAHGFCVLSNTADIVYKCTDLYVPDDEHGVYYADPQIGIQWPEKTPILSEKDSKYPNLNEIPEVHLPVYR